MEKIVSLCKRRGFIFPGSEIYGGLANSWDYGPLGVELKNNIKQLWWDRFVRQRDDIVGIDTALIMNPKIWEASGHTKTFSDLLSECVSCHHRVRVDHYLKPKEQTELNEKWKKSESDPKGLLSLQKEIQKTLNEKAACPQCGKKEWSAPKPFNLMLSTTLGATESGDKVYLRPETAQGMFVNFKNVLETMRPTLPFGIAQIGKAFRNEITPGNFVFRTREFEQMEIEYFVREKEWNTYFEHWLKEFRDWFEEIGLPQKLVHEVEVPEADRAFYSKRSVDFEFDFPFGQRELYGLAYRADYDLKNHETASGVNLKYRDPETKEEFWPHVIEPTWGVGRSVLALLTAAYSEEGDRTVLKLKPKLAPYKAAVFPLLANKPELIKKAKDVYQLLITNNQLLPIAWDDRGNIGKRYYSQDEIGTPFCITIDFDSLEKDDVTVRDRDTMKQERIKINELQQYLHGKIYC